MSLMEIVNEKRIETPIPIVDGYVTIELPEWGCRIIARVKQIKGQGTYDAIYLKGKKPDPQHLAIIYTMMDKPPMTAEKIRLVTKKELYFAEDQLYRKFEIQSWFQRKHSELLYWQILKKSGHKRQAPLYIVDVEKARALVKGGVFGE